MTEFSTDNIATFSEFGSSDCDQNALSNSERESERREIKRLENIISELKENIEMQSDIVKDYREQREMQDELLGRKETEIQIQAQKIQELQNQILDLVDQKCQQHEISLDKIRMNKSQSVIIDSINSSTVNLSTQEDSQVDNTESIKDRYYSFQKQIAELETRDREERIRQLEVIVNKQQKEMLQYYQQQKQLNQNISVLEKKFAKCVEQMESMGSYNPMNLHQGPTRVDGSLDKRFAVNAPFDKYTGLPFGLPEAQKHLYTQSTTNKRSRNMSFKCIDRTRSSSKYNPKQSFTNCDQRAVGTKTYLIGQNAINQLQKDINTKKLDECLDRIQKSDNYDADAPVRVSNMSKTEQKKLQETKYKQSPLNTVVGPKCIDKDMLLQCRPSKKLLKKKE